LTALRALPCAARASCSTLNRISGALPVRPLNEALLGPFALHTGPDWKSLGVLLAGGALVAIRRFRWDPRPE
jgi:ABC-2 type transport system permease protein